MRRWVPLLVVLGWVGMAPGVLVSLQARADSDAQLEMSWLVWVGYLVAMVVGTAWWRVRDREVTGSRQRGAVAGAVLLGVSVPVAVYVVGVLVVADPRPDGIVGGGVVAVVVFTVTALVLALLGTVVGRLMTSGQSVSSGSR
jgi:hypothetical protein